MMRVSKEPNIFDIRVFHEKTQVDTVTTLPFPKEQKNQGGRKRRTENTKKGGGAKGFLKAAPLFCV